MGLRLASLALLLLALCRPASSATVESINQKSTIQKSSISIKSSKVIKKPAAQPEGLPTGFADDMQNKNGDGFNVFLAFGYAVEGPDASADPDAMKIVNNGIWCAYDREPEKLKKVYNEAVYGAGGTVNFAKEKELPIGKKIDCSAEPKKEDAKCFCDGKTTIFYCAGLKYKETIKKEGKCKEEALKDLKNSGTGTLAKVFDYEALAKHEDKKSVTSVFAKSETAIDDITKMNDEMNKFFCDAIDPKVEAAVKALFASDATYMMVEGVFAAAIVQDEEDAVENACKNDNAWKKTLFGECVCSGDRGFTFCIYKALGEFFKQTGFLTCEVGAKFDPAKKPAASELPQMSPPKSAAASSSSSSSLLLLPFSAAAALLLLRH